MRTNSRKALAPFIGDRMANVWMHNGFLQVESEKMSKSLGNFITIRELLADWPGEVLRLNMLKTHYRSPIDWTEKALEESARTLDDWYAFAADVERRSAVCGRDRGAVGRPQHAADDRGAAWPAERVGLRQRTGPRGICGSLRLLGFLSESAAAGRGASSRRAASTRSRSTRLIADRTAARARKDFKESDRIRDELAAMGVVHQGLQGCRRQARDHLGDRAMTKPDTPFPRHWRIISRSVIAGAVALVLKLFGVVT